MMHSVGADTGKVTTGPGRRITLVILLALMAWAPAGHATPVSVGHSGWTWGDPTPQGFELESVDFRGPVGYAVGSFGTVLRSEDSGSSWLGLRSGTRDNLTSVQELDSDTVIVGGGCSVRESLDSGQSFRAILPIGSGSKCSSASEVAAFSFLDATEGFIEQKDGTLLFTSDSGQTMTSRTPVPLESGVAEQLAFISPEIGFAVVGGSSGGRILHTTDGGHSWTEVASAPASLTNLTFATPTTAYAVGANSTLLRSNDGGLTWAALPLGLPSGTPPQALTQIACSGTSDCLITTPRAPRGAANLLIYTTDGGMTGSLVSASNDSLLAIAFSSASHVVAVGEYGATVLSSDGGSTFSAAVSHNLGRGVLGEIRLGESPFDAYVPWIEGQIAATTDGGENWRLLRVPTGHNMQDVAFPSADAGYALDNSGNVFRTADGGLSWSLLNASGTPADWLLVPDAQTVLLVGARGLRRSTNAGESFHEVHGRVLRKTGHGRHVSYALAHFDLAGGAEAAEGAIFVFGKNVLRSTDDGASWQLLPRPLRSHPVTAIAFVDATTGYVASDHRLFFTNDAGRRWREILSVNASDLDSIMRMSFSSPTTGYIIGELNGHQTIIQRTEDGGRTWTPEVDAFPVGSITAAGAVDYAEGARTTSLYQTTDGGLSPNQTSITLSLAEPQRISPKLLRSNGYHVTLNGTITPAVASEPVQIQWISKGRKRAWHFKNVLSTSNGSFSLSVPGIHASTDFIAQWTGNDLYSGAGTPAVRLTVARGARGRSHPSSPG